MTYLFDYRTLHRGLGNMTREARPMLFLIFLRPWYRDHNLDQLKQRIRIKDEDLARLPSQLKPLFRLCAGRLNGLVGRGGIRPGRLARRRRRRR